MDNLLLDAETLFSTADIVDNYCARQRETINVYYAQIMALESEWEDDETFGGIVEEIRRLRSQTLAIIEQIHTTYPKYFRDRAQQIIARPKFNEGGATPIKVIEKVRVPSTHYYDGYAPRASYSSGYYPGTVLASHKSDANNYSSTSTPHSSSEGVPQNVSASSSNMSSNSGVLRGDSGEIHTGGEVTHRPSFSTYLGGNPSSMSFNTVPRQLTRTNEIMRSISEGVTVFDSPSETAKHMILKQGHVEGWMDYNGDCGLCAVGSCARVAGVDISEEGVITLAVYNKSGDIIVPLCDTTGNAANRNKGGTSPMDRQKLLNKLGIESELVDPSTDELAKAVCEGKGCIISVHADVLWYGERKYVTDEKGEKKINSTTGLPEYRPDGHALFVTSVKIENGSVTEFAVSDSGRQNGDHGEDWYSADLIQKSFTGKAMNVTTKALR